MRPAVTARVFALFAALTVATTAHAQTAAAPQPRPAPAAAITPMRVVIVRADLPDCGDACPRWISAEGLITPDTPAAFRDILDRLGETRLPVFIRSPGGVVNAALEIGRLIRARNLTVAVTGTRFVGCRPTDPTCKPDGDGADTPPYVGMPIATGTSCMSACAYLIAGGVERHVSRRAQVGVHSAATSQLTTVERYQMENGRPVKVERPALRRVAGVTPSGDINSRIADYLNEMGVSDLPLKRAATVPNTSIYWLTRAELRDSGLATHTTDGADLVLPAGIGAR